MTEITQTKIRKAFSDFNHFIPMSLRPRLWKEINVLHPNPDILFSSVFPNLKDIFFELEADRRVAAVDLLILISKAADDRPLLKIFPSTNPRLSVPSLDDPGFRKLACVNLLIGFDDPIIDPELKTAEGRAAFKEMTKLLLSESKKRWCRIGFDIFRQVADREATAANLKLIMDVTTTFWEEEVAPELILAP